MAPLADLRCLDPKVGACIDKWLAQVTRLLNQRQPDLGPWRFDRQGVLGSSNTHARLDADAFKVMYRGSRHCYVWANYRTLHKDAKLGGQLPSLSAFVQQCLKPRPAPPPVRRPSPSPQPAPPAPRVTLGDCDGDGRITWADAMCPLEMSVRKKPVDTAMDINRDGKVDSRDAVLILQRAVSSSAD